MARDDQGSPFDGEELHFSSHKTPFAAAETQGAGYLVVSRQPRAECSDDKRQDRSKVLVLFYLFCVSSFHAIWDVVWHGDVDNDGWIR